MLLTPVPLAGIRLPDAMVEPFRALGGDGEAQRGARRQLSVGLSEAALDRLMRSGLRLRPETVRALVDAWNTGHDDAPDRSGYTGPVLIIRGGGDGFATAELVATAVVPRFPAAQTVVVDAAGHWPDVEQPAVVAAHLDRFLAAQHSTGAAGGWTSAFANKSADDFAAAFADDVVLEATVLTRPIEGRHAVMRVMGTASEIYESLEFTHEASAGERSYLEWQSTAFGGLAIDGVTVLTRDAAGRIVRAAIHHRPLGGALRFSAELRERLTGVIDGDYFYDGAIVAEGSR